MADAPIVVHLDTEAQTRLMALAEARQQPVEDLAAELLASSLASDSWEHRHIQAGLAELEAGKGVPHDQVAAWLDHWGTNSELSVPK